MGNDISTENIPDEKNKKNNNFNKNNSGDLNKNYIIRDLDKDTEDLYLKLSGRRPESFKAFQPEKALKYYYKNGDFNKNVSGHLMNLDFSDIEEINEDYIFGSVDGNNFNNQINSRMISQNMICNNGQCKLRTKECINGQCKFKDSSFDIKKDETNQETKNIFVDSNDKNTSFKKFIQKYKQSFDDNNKNNQEKVQSDNEVQSDNTMNLDLSSQLKNPSFIKYNETIPLKEESIKPIETKYFQDSETFDEEFDSKQNQYDSNYPDNSLSSISDVFWKRSVF